MTTKEEELSEILHGYELTWKKNYNTLCKLIRQLIKELKKKESK